MKNDASKRIVDVLADARAEFDALPEHLKAALLVSLGALPGKAEQ